MFVKIYMIHTFLFEVVYLMYLNPSSPLLSSTLILPCDSYRPWCASNIIGVFSRVDNKWPSVVDTQMTTNDHK